MILCCLMILIHYSVIYHQMTIEVYHEWLADNDLKRDSHDTFEGILAALKMKHGGKA